jgi:predicted RNase H-like HicB family nuclease
MEEVRENLIEAAQLILESNREATEKRLSDPAKVKRERLTVEAA